MPISPFREVPRPNPVFEGPRSFSLLQDTPRHVIPPWRYRIYGVGSRPTFLYTSCSWDADRQYSYSYPTSDLRNMKDMFQRSFQLVVFLLAVFLSQLMQVLIESRFTSICSTKSKSPRVCHAKQAVAIYTLGKKVHIPMEQHGVDIGLEEFDWIVI